MFLTLDELEAELDETERARLVNLAFVIVRPDALARGFQSRIIDELGEIGLPVVGFKYEHVDERRMEELYRFTQLRMLSNQMRPLWWMTREMYRTSPALLLLVAGKLRGSFRDVAAFFDDHKGPANPALTQPRHLRHRFRAMNPILCIVHSSDGARETLREARIFFSREELRAALGHAERAIRGELPPPHEYLAASSARWYARAERPGSFFSVLATLKIRALAALLPLAKSGLDVRGVSRIHRRIAEVADEKRSYVEESSAVHPMLAEERALLDRVASSGPSSDDPFDASEALDRRLLLHALKWLTDPDRFDAIDFLRFKEILRRNLVEIDDWESLVLETSFVFHSIQLRGYFIPGDKPSDRG